MPFQLLPFDDLLTSRTELELVGKRIVQFQFPPIIKSDNKHLNWNEIDMRNIEPLGIFQGSKAREIEMKWTYIVTGGKWPAKKIAEMVKGIRSFFYASMMGVYGEGGETVIIRFHSNDVIGRPGIRPFTFRSDGINISYSDVMVTDTPSGLRDLYMDVFPLRTDLSMKLKLWSEGERQKGSENEKMTKIQGLLSATDIAPDWY